MIELTTGAPGASKTCLVVTELDKLEITNKLNLKKNLKIYEHNLPIFNRFLDDFSYYEQDSGSGHDIKTELILLEFDFFDFLSEDFDDLRPDYYFKRAVYYNEIIERIQERDGNQGFMLFLPVRTIYTNIRNLRIDYVRSLSDLLDSNGYVDWRKAPDGSVIVLDEIQLVPPFDQMKNKNEKIIQDLTIHRHRGFDFKVITQYPALLHPTVKSLVGLHRHITRPYGRTPKVYQWGSVRDSPNASNNRKVVETTYSFKPQDRIFKLYKSTTIDTHKKRFPKGIFIFLFIILLALALFVYGFNGAKKSSAFNDNTNTQSTTPLSDKPNPQSTTPLSDKPNPQSTTPLSDKPMNQAFQDKIESDLLIKEQDLYDDLLPPDYQVIIQNDDLRVAGVMSFNGKCSAYNKFGTRLNITHSECLEYANNSDKMIKADKQKQNSFSESPLSL